MAENVNIKALVHKEGGHLKATVSSPSCLDLGWIEYKDQDGLKPFRYYFVEAK